MAKSGKRPKGFREAQGKFAPGVELQSIFAAYDFNCAFTGRDLRIESAADPRGYLLNLSGDPAAIEPAALIPACLDAIFAFERGHVGIGPNYNFLVNLERIDPEFLPKLNAIGRLHLPADAALHPSQAALTPHLVAFVGGRRSRY
ncbi:MAG: hypothetical protein ABIQ30_01580 [Devosia sp.]